MRATIIQLAAFAGKSERTIRRYLSSGKWPHTILPGGLIEIDDSLIEPESEQGAILAALARIEARLDKLSASVDSLPAQPPQVRPSPARTAPVRLHTEQAEYHVRPDIPEGSIQVFAFARLHGIPEGTAKTQIKAGRLQDLEADKVNRPGEKEHYFTPEQQQAALQLWRYHPRFQECADCPHG